MAKKHHKDAAEYINQWVTISFIAC